MSFRINWESVEKESFSAYASELLQEALNSGTRPSILSDDIRIKELNFGTVAPSFQILEIGDLGVDKFRGIFNFKYSGDARITVTTKISASLLKNYASGMEEFVRPEFNVSDCDFDIPLNLTLSEFKMSSIIIIVFSKTKGLTLVFKNDPLENIDVTSTFDRIRPIARFLQVKIENGIRDLFREFLPSLLYKFSLKYTSKSFDQFHKDLLIEEEEEDNRQKNMTLLKDIDPENPYRISPGSLMRLTRLSSSRQTLGIENDSFSNDSINPDIVTKAFMNINSMSHNSRIELTENDFKGDLHNKLEFIRLYQNKTFLKNSSKPKRRIIKMRSTKTEPSTPILPPGSPLQVNTSLPTTPLLQPTPMKLSASQPSNNSLKSVSMRHVQSSQGVSPPSYDIKSHQDQGGSRSRQLYEKLATGPPPYGSSLQN
ncbi:ERMES complex subunit [Martiniozyma asiatica (nom. inval.)]|nr:ERMES complex subunit [Martiniozyma asiatica]